MSLKVLDGAGNGVTSEEFILRAHAQKAAMQIAGIFDGGTVTVEASLDEGTTFSTVFSVTAEDFRTVDRTDATYRAATSAGGTSMAIDMWVDVSQGS